VLTARLAVGDPNPAAAIAASKAAEQLAADSKYVEAAAKYREAFALDPRPEFLCNVGVAYQRAKQLPKAQVYLAECLRRGGHFEAAFVTAIRTGLEAVEAKLRDGDFTPLDVVVEPRGALVRVDDDPPAEAMVGSRLIYVPFGHHTLAVTADGFVEQRREVDVVSRSQRQVTIQLVARPRTITRTTRRSRAPAVVTLVTTLALGGGSAGAYLYARNVMRDAGSTTINRPTYDATVDRSRGWQHISWALAGGAGVSAIATVLLWRRGGTRIEVSTSSGGGAISWGGPW